MNEIATFRNQRTDPLAGFATTVSSFIPSEEECDPENFLLTPYSVDDRIATQRRCHEMLLLVTKIIYLLLHWL
jgi:hypothetical protein